MSRIAKAIEEDLWGARWKQCVDSPYFYDSRMYPEPEDANDNSFLTDYSAHDILCLDEQMRRWSGHYDDWEDANLDSNNWECPYCDSLQLSTVYRCS